MSKLYPRSDSKYLWYTIGDGKDRIRKSTGCMDYRSARVIQKLWDTKYITNKTTKRITCGRLIMNYLSLLENRKSKGWYIRIRSGLNKFNSVYNNVNVSDCDVDLMDRYMSIREKLIAPKTMVEEIKIINNFFKFAIARRFANINPCTDLILPKIVQVRKTRAFTKEEAKSLLATKHPKDYLLWHILFYTGLRVGDALSLNRSQIHNGYIKREQTKTGNKVIIPIHHKLEPILKNGFEDDMMKYGAIGRSRERVKIIADDCNLHTFRHTFATFLEDYCGASRYDVKVLLGHKNGDVTSNYIHTNVDRLESIINKLDIN